MKTKLVNSSLPTEISYVRYAMLLLLGLVVLQNIGCSTMGNLGDSCSPREGNVILVRGLAGYWPKVDELADDLREEGICPTIVGGLNCGEVTDALQRSQCNGCRNEPLVVVGYSVGANHAIRICRELGEKGIDVDCLLLVETTLRDSIPANVHYCYNVFESRRGDWLPWFRGLPVTAECCQTCLVNHDVKSVSAFDQFNHFTIASNSCMFSILKCKICQACPCRDAACQSANACQECRDGGH